MPKPFLSAQQKHNRIHFIYLAACQRDFAERQAQRGLFIPTVVPLRGKGGQAGHGDHRGDTVTGGTEAANNRCCGEKARALPHEQARCPHVSQSQTKPEGGWE